MPFDRLIRAVDEWASLRSRTDIFAQIGSTDYRPNSIKFVRSLDPINFCKNVEAASFVIAHAGMGSIITALEYGKPIIIMPRRGDLRETRNDHQVATAMRLMERRGITVALNEKDLIDKLDQIEVGNEFERIEPYASENLIAALRNFVERESRKKQG